MVFISIGVLISGVVSAPPLSPHPPPSGASQYHTDSRQVLLSLKSSANSAPDPYTVSAQPSSAMRLNPRARVVSKQSDGDREDVENRDGASYEGPKRDEVMWEVGSVSDDEDGPEGRGDGPEEPKRGLGEGSGRGTGERRGLLDDEEADGSGPMDPKLDNDRSSQRARQEEDEEEGFGEYEAVPRLSTEESRHDR